MIAIIMRVLGKYSLALFFSAATVCGAFASTGPTFDEWRESMKEKAVNAGVSRQTAERELSNLTFNPSVITLDKKQPESTITFAEYRKRVVTQARIDQGRRMMQQHAAELEKASLKYGVEPQYIVALWGMETSYGAITGKNDVLDSLATLAHSGRLGSDGTRREFFTNEVIDALKIIDEGHITRARMKGSWAGAMGHNQFMPSSFRRLAVDGDGDGRKDIWNNLSDVFASSANYLNQNGWKDGERWGREVKAGPSFPQNLLSMKNSEQLKITKSLAEWQQLGLTLPDGSPLPVVAGMNASLVTPDGIGGPAYLVYDNYRTIMKWNRSTYFATSVGILANAIATP